MAGARRSTAVVVLMAVFILAGLGCGGGGEGGGEGWREVSPGAPSGEGTEIAAKAASVTVTYYYLPG